MNISFDITNIRELENLFMILSDIPYVKMDSLKTHYEQMLTFAYRNINQ